MTATMIIGFALALFGMVGAVFGYLEWSVIRSSGFNARWRWRLGIGLFVLAMPLTLILRYRYGYNAGTIMLSWVGWGLAGVLFFGLSLLILRDLGWGTHRTWRRVRGAEPIDPERRELFFRASGAAIGATTLVVGGNGVRAARRTAAVKDVAVPIADLPAQLADLRIVQLSDIHVGDTIGDDYLARIVARTMTLNADMILITGDLIDGRVRELSDHLSALSQLHAPLGVYYTTGNHEYYFDAERWVEEVAKYGIRPLMNEHVVINYRGRRIVLGGIPDHDAEHFVASHKPDVAATFAGAPEADLRLLMAHQPRSYPLALDQGVTLQLSGHTHGGQIWPFGFLVPMQQYFVAGLHRAEDGMWVYVSRGTGYWGPPMRVGADSEITRLRFVNAASAPPQGTTPA